MRHAEAMQQIVKHRAVLALGAGGGLLQQQTPFFQLQMHRHAGRVLLRQLVAIALEHIPPGFDDKLMLGDLGGRELALPGVVAEQLQSCPPPAGFAFFTPAHGGGQLVVAVGENLAGHDHWLADDRLGGKAPLIQHRQGGFDGDARHLQGFFESRVNRRGRLCIAHRTGSWGAWVRVARAASGRVIVRFGRRPVRFSSALSSEPSDPGKFSPGRPLASPSGDRSSLVERNTAVAVFKPPVSGCRTRPRRRSPAPRAATIGRNLAYVGRSMQNGRQG